MVFFVTPVTLCSFYVVVLVNEQDVSSCSVAGCMYFQKRVSVGFDYETSLLQCIQMGDHTLEPLCGLRVGCVKTTRASENFDT
jgi:hypothetical protein